MKSMHNTIWKLDKDKLQDILNSCNTLAEVLLKIDMSLHGNNYKELNNRIKEDSLSLDKLNKNRKAKSFGGINALDLDKILVENSTYSRQDLKRRLVKENLLKYKCSICNNPGHWNNQELVLQLDHINGINSDNRLENLRFLCPNCHTQTETYAGRGRRKEIIQNKCVDCNCNIHIKSTRCGKCSKINNKVNFSRPLKFEVTKEELQELVDKYPMVYIGKIFDVSDNAVKKRCIKLEVDYKKKK
jgi:Zn finger protein HypA/HybF involved in hydrogenase expression